MNVLLAGYFGFGNLGDEALLAVWTEQLKEKHALFAFSGKPDYTSTHFPVIAFPRSVQSILPALQRADLLFFPGGSVLQDRTSLRSLLFYACQVLLAVKLRKKVFFYGQGIGPLRRKLSQKIASFCLRQAERVTVRDEESKMFCDQNSIQAEEVIDAAYTLPTKPICRGLHILVPYRDFLIAGDWQTQLPSQKVCQFLFHPTQESCLPEFPYAAWRKVANPFQGAKSVFCARLHAAIFAHAAGVPFFVVGHDPKLRSWVKKTNWKYSSSSMIRGKKQLDTLSNFYAVLLDLRKMLSKERKNFYGQARSDMSDFTKACFWV